jgi:outer membrane protein TolC
MCRERSRIARLLQNSEGRDPEEMFAHEEEVARAVDRLATASQNAEERRLEVNRLLGLDPDLRVELTDLDPLKEGDSGETVEEAPEAAFAAAWDRLPEVRIAEIDLFLAELGVSIAKLGRLPKASADLELGSLDTQGSDSNAPVLVNLDLSAPLLDWGDIRRRTTSRTIDREMMRQKIVALARDLRDRLRAADFDCRNARARTHDAMTRLALVRRRASLGDRLRAAGKRDFLDRFTDGLALAAVECEWRRRAIALGTAERMRRYEAGTFPDPLVCERLVNDAARAARKLTEPSEEAPSPEQE